VVVAEAVEQGQLLEPLLLEQQIPVAVAAELARAQMLLVDQVLLLYLTLAHKNLQAEQLLVLVAIQFIHLLVVEV